MVDQDVGIGGRSVLCIWISDVRVWSGFLFGREWSGKKFFEGWGWNGARETSLCVTALPHGYGFAEQANNLAMKLYRERELEREREREIEKFWIQTLVEWRQRREASFWIEEV